MVNDEHMISLTGELVKRLLAIVACVFLLIPPLPLRSPASTTPQTDSSSLYNNSGSLTVDHGWSRLRLRGSPYEMGYQQGTLLGTRIRWLLAEAVYPSLVEAGVEGPLLAHVVRVAADALPVSVQEEVRGIADGAGVTVADVVVLNLWADLFLIPPQRLMYHVTQNQEARWALNRALRDDVRLPLRYGVRLTRHLPRRAPAPWLMSGTQSPRPGSGRALAAWRSATIDQRLWFAAHLDGYPQGPQPLLVERWPDRGKHTIGVALPGWVGLVAGMNAEGLGLVVIRAPSVDTSLIGVTPPILARQALEDVESSEAALRVLVSRLRTGGAQLLLTDSARSSALALELSARQFRVREAAQPWILVGSSPRSRELQEFEAPATTPVWESFDQLTLSRITPWLRLNAGFIGRDLLEALLTELGSGDPHAWVMLIGEPADRRLWLAQPANGIPAPASGFTNVVLEEQAN